jgi:hypothetical protein
LNRPTRRRSCDRFGHAAHAKSLSLRALRTSSVAGPRCAALTWPRCCGALASSCRTVRPSVPATRVSSQFLPSSSYRTTPPFFSLGPVARTPLGRANPIPSFLLFPTQARTGSAPWPTPSPPRDPLVIPLYATPTLGALHHHLRPPSFYNATLLASPPFHP